MEAWMRTKHDTQVGRASEENQTRIRREPWVYRVRIYRKCSTVAHSSAAVCALRHYTKYTYTPTCHPWLPYCAIQGRCVDSTKTHLVCRRRRDCDLALGLGLPAPLAALPVATVVTPHSPLLSALCPSDDPDDPFAAFGSFCASPRTRPLSSRASKARITRSSALLTAP